MRHKQLSKWMEKYTLAATYHKHHGDLEIPKKFKTKNGYEYDEDGVYLGLWLNEQRKSYNGKGQCILDSEQINLLNKIGMRFNEKRTNLDWNTMYNLAFIYRNYHGNLEVPCTFKTNDGYFYDDEGLPLGHWIHSQRQVYKNKKEMNERMKLLSDLGMRFTINYDELEWEKKFELASTYRKYYGSLEIPCNFKTKDGYTYDEAGVSLGTWIVSQRQAYKHQSTFVITDEQVKRLKEIGMRFDTLSIDDEWNKKYELAKSYSTEFGNLDVAWDFKTSDGINYDNNGIALGKWLNSQKQVFIGRGRGVITEDRINKLSYLGMKWISDKTDDKLQKEEITEENKLRKEKEIYNRFVEYLLTYNIDTSVTNEEISNNFIKKLNRERR